MKKFAMLLLFALVFIFPKTALAKVIIEEKGVVTIPTSETIDDDLFVGAETINLSGTITGSVFAGANTSHIKGNIKGDLVAAGNKITITGIIGGDIYAGAGDITLTNALVGGNVIIGSGNITIDNLTQITGSLIAGAGNFRSYAPVGRNAMIGAGNIYLDNKIGKEARLAGGNIELGPLTSISGNLIYALGEKNNSIFSKDPAATIGGTISQFTPPVDTSGNMAKARDNFGKFGVMAQKGWLVVSFLGALLVGFLLIKLFPKTIQGISSDLSKSLTSSLGVGFLVVIAVIPLCLILAITMVGIPLAGLLFGVFWIDVYLSKIVASYVLGKFVATQFNWSKMGVYGVYAIGLIVFCLLRAIPFVGWIVSVIFTWVGLGGIWLYSRSQLKNL